MLKQERVKEVVLSTERRRNSRLRAIYPDACLRLARSFHEQNDWAGSSDLLAQRVLHEAYPDLAPVEIHALVKAIDGHLQSELERLLGLPSAA
jgi:hypothetical protein